MGTVNVLYNGPTLWQLPVCYSALVENFILIGDKNDMKMLISMLLIITITIINNVLSIESHHIVTTQQTSLFLVLSS